jgi:hypothetical protein
MPQGKGASSKSATCGAVARRRRRTTVTTRPTSTSASTTSMRGDAVRKRQPSCSRRGTGTCEMLR